MVQHITQGLESVNKLKVMGGDIKYYHVATQRLVPMLKYYDNLITSQEARREIELTPDFIKSILTDEYNHRKGQILERNSLEIYKTNSKLIISHQNNLKANTHRVYCRQHVHDHVNCFYLKNKYKNNIKKNSILKKNFPNKLNY